jgi:ABC-2 type transport system permease protein
MTATATRPATPAHVTRGARPLAGTGMLLRFNLRRDRIRLPLWIGGIALMQISGPSSYEGIYPGPPNGRNRPPWSAATRR